MYLQSFLRHGALILFLGLLMNGNNSIQGVLLEDLGDETHTLDDYIKCSTPLLLQNVVNSFAL